LGLAGAKQADFIQLNWPDGAYESELDLAVAKHHKIAEENRIPVSCPLIFAWNGKRFGFVTDCLGVGGLGFAIGPGVYSPVVPRESVLFPPDSLAPLGRSIVVKLHEPGEELTYLDGAKLVAYDLPTGWHLTVDDRLVVEGPAATGEARFFRRVQQPVRAVNDRDEDVTRLILAADSKPVAPSRFDPHFLGRTAEHALTLTFDAPLAGPGEPMLVIDGWVEFPYSQTMVAAAQAGAVYRAPTLEACDAMGEWHAILTEFGYPGGMPRQMSAPIPKDKLPAGCRKLRLRTNQEIYWDKVIVAWAEPCPTAARQELPLEAAELQFSGFARRSVGPERQPDFDYSRRVPIDDARYPAGDYTAYGDVLPLVAAVDDATAIFGPGEEVELRFAAPRREPPRGHTRRYVLEVAGWCKDMDLYTRDGETVGPLPSRGEATDAILRHRDRLHRQFNTRYQAGK
jgi:hypothetical protein